LDCGKLQEALNLIQNLSREKPDQRELNHLIRLCCNLAVHTLRLRFGSHFHLFGEDSGSLEDAAIDAIAPLFTASQDDDRFSIVRSMENWHTDITTEQQAAWFLNNIILRRVEQHVGQSLKQDDPVFGRMLKVINYHILTRHWFKLCHFGTWFITEKSNEVICGAVYDYDALAALPANLFMGSPPRIIQSLFDYLHQQDDYFPAIPLYALIKRLQAQLQWTESSGKILEISSNEEMLVMREIIDLGFVKATERLKTFYIKKNKLTEEEGRCFRQTLHDLAEDMQDGGVTRGLYEYLQQHFTNLDQKLFYEKYRPILDYLLRIMKQTMREAMQE
jgi:hypothetical protein